MHLRSRRGGFTLVEIMIVVAILGILAAIAIPSFMTYQARSRRAESYTNVFAIIQTSDAYYSEYQTYLSVPPVPGGIGAIVGTQKRLWDAVSEAAFAPLGWTPEGSVYYDYSVNAGSNGGLACNGVCATPGTCVAAAAYGDVDGDGAIGVVLYARGDPVNYCPDYLLGEQPIATMFSQPATYQNLIPPSAPF